MFNYEAELPLIEPMEADSTDAEIASALVAMRLTHRNVPITHGPGIDQDKTVMAILGKYKVLWLSGASESYVGPLKTAAGADADSEYAIGRLIAYMKVPGSIVRCAEDPEQANFLYDLAMAAAGVLNAQTAGSGDELLAELESLSGGRRATNAQGDDIVAQDVTDGRLAKAAKDAQAVRQKAASDALKAFTARCQAASDAAQNEFRTRDYSQDVDHASAIAVAGETAFNA